MRVPLMTSAAFAVAALVLAGCGRTGGALGAGEPIDLCGGWRVLDGFDAPDVDDAGETARWAEGVVRVIDRVDLTIPVDEEPVPDEIAEELEAMDGAARAYADALRDGQDEGSEAWLELTTGPFDRSAAVVSAYVERRC